MLEHAAIVIYRAENGWTASVRTDPSFTGRQYVAKDLVEMGQILAEATKRETSPKQASDQ